MRHPWLIAKAATASFLIGAVSIPVTQAQTGSPSATTFHLLETTIDDVHSALQSKQMTCRALVELYLKRIQAYDKSGPALNAIQTVNPRALREADRLDSAFRSSGPLGTLHCIPVLIKDQIDTSDMPTTYGSAVFRDFVPQADATIVTKLTRAGAVVIGKATMGEYASSYFSSVSGPIRNAYDPTRNASGSSGGTGSGVAANFATIGIGEDTGGSIRGPASVSSLVGVRPTVPLVSRNGVFPARPTIDTLGPITRTVKDAALVLDVIAGYDPKDPVTAYAVGHIPTSYAASLTRDGLKGARIGVIRQPMDPKTDITSDDYRKVRSVIDKAVSELKTLGAELVDPVQIPKLSERVNTAYDGNQFETEQAINEFLAQRPNAPVKTLRDILLSGKVVPSRVRSLMDSVGKSTTDPGYLQILRLVEETRQIVLGQMAENRLDALVYATFDHQPREIAPDVMTKSVVDDVAGLGNNRRLSSMLAFPAISVPAGFTTDGLPVGIEFMARAFGEATLVKFAYAYEQGTHHRKPPRLLPALRGEP
jgi:amidase